MRHRALGSLLVSEVGVGCNNFGDTFGSRLDRNGATVVVNAALESGINFFDTADIYGATKSEVLLGEALGARRHEAVIATKFGVIMGTSTFSAKPDYVRSACEASLRRLNTDYIDLYQLHYPDETTPIADTIGAMQELVASGKVREIGCSNLTADQLRQAKVAAGDGPAFVSIQNQYSLLERGPEHDGVLDTCDELGVSFLPFYPLANGLLTGKVRPGEPLPEGTRLANMPAERSAPWLSDQFSSRVSALLNYSEKVQVPLLTFAFSWLLSHPAVASVIAGASTAEQIHGNANASIKLDADKIDELNRITAS